MTIDYDYMVEYNYSDFSHSIDYHELFNMSGVYQAMPARDLTRFDVVQFSLNTILSGILLGLVFLSLMNLHGRIKSQPINLPPTLFLFYELIAIVLVVMAVCVLVEYFLFFDFFFFQSIEWKSHHQWLSYLIDFGSLTMKCLIMSLGLHHALTLTNWGYCSSTGNIIKRCYLPWTLFTFNVFCLPITAVLIRKEMELYTLTNTIESTLIPMFVSLVLFTLVMVKGNQRFRSNIVCQREEVLATKLVLLYLLILMLSGVQEMILYDIITLFLHRYVMQVLDLASTVLGGSNLILFPALYLAFFGDNPIKNSDNILQCVNSKNIQQTQPILPDPSLILGRPSASDDSSIEIPSSTVQHQDAGSYFRRLFPSGVISYNTLTESHNTEMNSLIEVTIEETDEESAKK